MRAFVVLAFIYSAVRAQSTSDPFPTLAETHLEALSQDAAQASPDTLISAALTCGKNQDWERANFFLWAAQIRLQFDRVVFPPVKTGGDSPTLPQFAIAKILSQEYLMRLYLSPPLHRAAIGRLRNYSPDFPPNYRPFWEYTTGVAKAEAQATARKAVLGLADSSARILTLTAIPEYLENLRIFADYSDQSRERPVRLRSANAILSRIEHEQKIESGLVFPPRLETTRTAIPSEVPNR